MKSFTIALLALLGIVGLGIYFAANRPLTGTSEATPAREPDTVVTAPPVLMPEKVTTADAASNDKGSKPRVIDGGARNGQARILIKEGDPIPELFPHQAERDAIAELASTYDAKEIPKIAVYLSHADATVREAARSGLIQLGDAAAVPVLNAAAAKARTPEEAVALREAAEFLALPRFGEEALPTKPSPVVSMP